MRVCTITASWVFWHRATTYRSHLVISPIMLISSYFKWCFLNWYMQLYKIHTYTHIPTCTHIHTYWHAQDMHKPAPPLKCKYTIQSDTICSNYSFGKFPGEKLPPAGFELPPTFLLYHNERHVSGISKIAERNVTYAVTRAAPLLIIVKMLEELVSSNQESHLDSDDQCYKKETLWILNNSKCIRKQSNIQINQGCPLY